MALLSELWELHHKWDTQLKDIPRHKREYLRLRNCMTDLMEVMQREEGRKS